MKSHIIANGVAGVGALLLFSAAFIGRTRNAPGFVRFQLILTGLVGLAWSVIGVYLYSHAADSSHTLLPWSRYWALTLIKATLGGVVIGILATLFTNPEYYKWKRRVRANI